MAVLLILSFISLPFAAEASFFSSILGNSASASTAGNSDTNAVNNSSSNSQNLLILQSAVSPADLSQQGGGEITVDNNSALVAEIGPLGSASDVKSEYLSDQITNYVVRKGDTLKGIADMFDISENTILWANDMKKSDTISPGDTLTILPVTGVQYTVKKGDTLAGIAKKFKADIGDVGTFNGLTADSLLSVGDTIIIPDGEADVAVEKSSASVPLHEATYNDGGPVSPGYYIRPVVGGVRTQGIHSHNGVDLGGLPVGSPVMAAAAGVVIISRDSGWNGGYGRYIVISHNNGTQTLYGHLNATLATVGEEVKQGQVIGYLGNTGLSTGPHLHFEVRGAFNPGADGSWASR